MEIYAYVPTSNVDEKPNEQFLADVSVATLAAFWVNRVGGDVAAVGLIHHFVEEIEGIVVTDESATTSEKPVLPCVLFLRKRGHRKRTMKLNMSSSWYFRGLLNNLVRLPKVLMIRCFMTRILQCTSLGSPCRQTNVAVTSFLNVGIYYIALRLLQ